MSGSRWLQFAVSLIPLTVMASAGSVHAADRPNVVLIMSDDMGFSDLGCYGGEIRTPHLDALAAGGVRFTQFYNTARCCPTRASLMTGLYSHQAGVGHMMDDRGADSPGYRGNLNRDCVTIAEALKPAGYRSYMVGKWHVTRFIGPEADKANWPLQRGFDRYYGIIGGAASFFEPFTLTRDNIRISNFADPEYRPERYYLTDAFADHAIKFVGEHARDHADQPFFLYAAFTAAHWPMHALPEDIARYRGKFAGGYEPTRQARLAKEAQLGLVQPGQDRAATAGDWDRVADKQLEASYMEVYAAMVDRMDQGIGRIVAELKRTGQFDNTLILFLQDNGACAEDQGRVVTERRIDGPRADGPTLKPRAPGVFPGQPPLQTIDGYPVRMGPHVEPGPSDTFVAYGRGWANVSNTPFREYKHYVHEGGISTPLIAHWPRGIAAKGELRRQPGHLIDVMPTVLEVAQAPYPTEAHGGRAITPAAGKSLIPAFADRPIDRHALFWEHEGNRAVRVGDWKLVAKGPGGAWELYDIGADRGEQHDLAAQHPDRVADLKGRWEAWANRSQVLPWIWKPAYGQPAVPGQVEPKPES